MSEAAPRTLATRIADTLSRLENDIDVWVATADADGTPYLVPLSFLWDGADLIVATPGPGPTGRNLQSGKARVALGPTRDVVLIEAQVSVLAAADLPRELGDAFAAKTEFDPRELATPYVYFRITPRRVQAWREVNELADRELMRDGAWRNTD